MISEEVIKEHLNDVLFYIAINFWYIFLLVAIIFFLLSIKLFKDKATLRHKLERIGSFLDRLSSFEKLHQVEDYIVQNSKVFEAEYAGIYLKRGEIYILQARSHENEVYFPNRFYKKDIIESLQTGSFYRYMMLSSNENVLLVLFSKKKILIETYKGFIKSVLSYYFQVLRSHKEQSLVTLSDASNELLSSMMRFQSDTKTFLKFVVSLLLKIKGVSGVKLIDKREPSRAKVFRHPERGLFHKKFYIRNTPFIVEVHTTKELEKGEVSQIGSFLDLAGSYFENASENSKMIKNYIEFLRVSNHALEMQSPYFKDHSKKVKIAAVEIAKALFLDEKSIDTIALGAEFHDIGMIGKLESFLNSSKVDKKGLDLIHYHPIIGSILVEPISFAFNIVPIVKYHHERFDGSGYPYGLRGKDIPLFAQIVALAEYYVGVTSPRAYREAMSHEDALKEIESLKDKLVDEQIIDAFLESSEGIKKKIELLDAK